MEGSVGNISSGCFWQLLQKATNWKAKRGGRRRQSSWRSASPTQRSDLCESHQQVRLRTGHLGLLNSIFSFSSHSASVAQRHLCTEAIFAAFKETINHLLLWLPERVFRLSHVRFARPAGIWSLENITHKVCNSFHYLPPPPLPHTSIYSLFRNKQEMDFFFHFLRLTESNWWKYFTFGIMFCEGSYPNTCEKVGKSKCRPWGQIPCVNDINWRTNISFQTLVLNLKNLSHLNYEVGGENSFG